ncbi:MAG: Universal stress protein UspA-related nucleotide-binding protein [Candidatus Aramenus sulfurataquae]|jgi:nucleotide-binding universal stress UspA family protein|uniref:Universal stress protein UspA-related nucleotide-binding protein n=3 Tax=Candidatus Aramenus sulfurataquae TaxID=1326980 RepID=W7KWT2_9CREN|nr:MAG: Universal stress protein UspA-related nucleotide-binding protein [Candidatus Aramenus sulfurataquae]
MVMFERILVAYDGSENAKRALLQGIELAKLFNSRLFVVEAIDLTVFYNAGILPPLSALKDLEKKVKADMAEATELAKSQGVDVITEVIEGDPATSVLDYAEKNNVDLIVVGSRGLSRFKRVFLGSVSTAILKHAKVPVMVVK